MTGVQTCALPILPVSSLLVSVAISPFSARCPRYVFALCLIISQLSFAYCGHQPFSCPMSTVCSCSVADCQSVVFCQCGHRPFSCPMSTVRSCSEADCQSFAFCQCSHQPFFCPMVTVHGVRLYCLSGVERSVLPYFISCCNAMSVLPGIIGLICCV